MKRYLLPLVVTAGSARAETRIADVTDVEELSLADLLDTQVDVASVKPQKTRETPGIVTVITREDILDSGARDLLDVLQLVPGFSPGVDVEGVVDIGVRGNWGHEGKVLLLIDGQPMNELLYSTLQLANHYPVDMIEKIEVIRGPGSAIYGGFAELAVINIITRDADSSLDGIAVSTSLGQEGKNLGHADTTLSFATKDTGVPELTAAGVVGLGRAYSSGTYTDFAGDSYAMSQSASRDPLFAKLAFGFRGLRVDAIYDDYTMTIRDGVGPVTPGVRQRFRSYHLGARYNIKLRDDMTLTPYFGLIHQTPWQITDTSSELFYDKTVSRYTFGTSLSYDASEHLNILGGVEAFADRAHLGATELVGLQTMFGDSTEVAYDTIATYGQVLVNHEIANLTVGARLEHHSAVGSSLVPRVALTRVFGRLHAKLLAAQAFRAPGVENINLSGGSLAPEKTTVFEGEVGYELTQHMYLALNAYDITIKKPIVYDFDQAAMTEGYMNGDHTGTRGIEVDYRVKYPRGYANLNYSYYSSAGKNTVDAYAVPGHDEALLAFPSHKVAMTTRLDLYKGLAFTPSAVIYGPRYGYLTGDVDGTPMIGREPTTALVNLYARYSNLLTKGLEVGAGVFDVADQHVRYLQPYNGGHAPLPGPGREFVLRVSYEKKL